MVPIWSIIASNKSPSSAVMYLTASNKSPSSTVMYHQRERERGGQPWEWRKKKNFIQCIYFHPHLANVVQNLMKSTVQNIWIVHNIVHPFSYLNRTKAVWIRQTLPLHIYIDINKIPYNIAAKPPQNHMTSQETWRFQSLCLYIILQSSSSSRTGVTRWCLPGSSESSPQGAALLSLTQTGWWESVKGDGGKRGDL